MNYNSVVHTEQHDDLFSWKKYNNYTHVNAVQKYRMWRMLFEHGNKLFLQKYMFSLCWP